MLDMKKIFTAIMSGNVAFELESSDGKILFTRRNVANGIDVLYCVESYGRSGLDWALKVPDVLGYLVGEGADCRVYGLKYPYSSYAEEETDSGIRAFFSGSIGLARKALQHEISAILIRRLAVEYAENRCVPSDKLVAFRKEADESKSLLDSVISGKRPCPEEIAIEVSTGEVLQALADVQLGVRRTIDGIVAKLTAPGMWQPQQETYAYRRVLGEAYDARIAAATPDDKLAQSVAAAFSEAKEKGAKNVVLEILGKDSNISPYTKHHFPDFTIEGKVIRGRYDAEHPRFEANRLGSPYDFTADDPLKEHYSNRNVTFLDEIYYADIVRISYKGKTLYENPELVSAA